MATAASISARLTDARLGSQLGRTIDLFDWTGVSPTGAFNVSSPYTWNLSMLYTTGEVTLTAVPSVVPGDFNGNGVVDAADYVVWRKNFGTPTSYNTWRAHFGQTAGNGTGFSAIASVPEPTSAALGLMALACMAATPRLIRQRSCVVRVWTFTVQLR